MSGKIIIASNTAWSLFNFRAGLIRVLVGAGYEVVATAPPDDYVSRLTSLGCRFVPLPMDNKGTNPIRDAFLFFRYRRLLRQECPDAFFGYTVKPNVYGSLAAHRLGIPVVNNIAGLGTAFIGGGWLRAVVTRLYRLALGRSRRVFFQNEEDQRLFVESGIARARQAERLPGSGVDLEAFAPRPAPAGRGTHFLLSARMIWGKGVREYVEAARKLRLNHPSVRFTLLGPIGVANRSAIPESRIQQWGDEGMVRYLGAAVDVRPFIAQTDCVVLPSYYPEGVPRSLLEAAAMARPIVTTDTPGCRDVVENGINGFLCRPRDANDLAEKMGRIIEMAPEERSRMGMAGRRKVEREFDERIVIRRYLETIEDILGSRTTASAS